LGGLCPMIVEITEYLKTADFDFVVIETVGVGQTEIDIAGLADITIVTLTPETGDEIQTMKSGIIEIADIFVVNKSDKSGADVLVKNLNSMLAPHMKVNDVIPIIKTIANTGAGIDELYKIVEEKAADLKMIDDKKCWLLAERAYHIIQLNRMKNVDTAYLFEQIKKQTQNGERFNLYRFVQPMLA